MTRVEIIKFIKKEFNVEPSYLFADDTVVFKNQNKWFGVIMNVPRYRVIKKDTDTIPIEILNVKLSPEFIESIKYTRGFAPAYHMNKNHWLSIILNEVENEKIKTLIKMSYGNVRKNSKWSDDFVLEHTDEIAIW